MLQKIKCWLGFHHYCLFVYHGSETIEYMKGVWIRPTTKSVVKCDHCGKKSSKWQYAEKIHIVGEYDENTNSSEH